MLSTYSILISSLDSLLFELQLKNQNSSCLKRIPYKFHCFYANFFLKGKLLDVLKYDLIYSKYKLPINILSCKHTASKYWCIILNNFFCVCWHQNIKKDILKLFILPKFCYAANARLSLSHNIG